MTWTHEIVEQLKTLWAEGQSASVIAGRIGGITRNAVIGKVHRLGLPGRATRSRTRTVTRARAPYRWTPRTPAARSPATCPLAKPPRTRIRNSPRSPASPIPQRTALLPELGPAPAAPVTVTTLTGFTCRWPVGDPFDADFHFCGRAADERQPYCAHHMMIAHR